MIINNNNTITIIYFFRHSTYVYAPSFGTYKYVFRSYETNSLETAESGAAVRAEARRVMSVAVNTWMDPPASVADE